MKKILMLGMTVLILSMLVIGCGDDDNSGGGGVVIIPSEIQGIWIWNRNNGSGHTIIRTVNSSTVTMVESNDPGGNNGTETVTITNVRKGSVQNIDGENWTEYFFTVQGIGEIMWGLSSDKQRLADPNGNQIDDFPRVYNKQQQQQ